MDPTNIKFAIRTNALHGQLTTTIICMYLYTWMILQLQEQLSGDDDGSEDAATQHAMAQLALLAAAAASDSVCPASAAFTREQVTQHMDTVMTTLCRVQLKALQGDAASQARMIGCTAVALYLLPKSLLSSLPPAQPAAIVQACWEQLELGKNDRNLRFHQQITAATKARVRTMLPDHFLHRSSPCTLLARCVVQRMF